MCPRGLPSNRAHVITGTIPVIKMEVILGIKKKLKTIKKK